MRAVRAALFSMEPGFDLPAFVVQFPALANCSETRLELMSHQENPAITEMDTQRQLINSPGNIHFFSCGSYQPF